MLDDAQRNAGAYTSTSVSSMVPARHSSGAKVELKPRPRCETCVYCGYSSHDRRDCPAWDKMCYKCGKKGHFSRVCQAKHSKLTVNAACVGDALAILAQQGKTGSCVDVAICVNGVPGTALVDTGATGNHISGAYCRRAKLHTYATTECIDLAVKASKVTPHGSCCVTVDAFDRRYDNVTFSVLDGLLWDVISWERIHGIA